MFPDVSTEDDEEGDDEDGSSDEFTDSIEDDEKVTPASLPFTEVGFSLPYPRRLVSTPRAVTPRTIKRVFVASNGPWT